MDERNTGDPSLETRMVRAAKLEPGLYDEVNADTAASKQAFFAVILSGVSLGIGLSVGVGLETASGVRLADVDWGQFALYLVSPVLGGILFWLVWSLLAYWIGTTILRTEETSATYRGVLRAVGFANSPGVLGFLSLLPYIGPIILLVVSAWVLVAEIVALRQAIHLSTLRAVGVWVLSTLPLWALNLVAWWLA
jgi:hypothetical protein